MIPLIQFRDLSLSRLMLGTVQFGLPYGIANKTGQPSYQDVRDILSAAYENGVNCLDTAAAYGQSEEVIGRALGDLELLERFVVVTKISPLDDSLSPVSAKRAIEESLQQSLKRLRVEQIPIVLFHRESNWRYVDELMEMKDRGLVRYIGVACYTPEIAIEIIQSGLADALQVPCSALDHRFISAGVFEEASNRRVAVFIRSVYLQGLLLMPESEIHPGLSEVIPARQRLLEIAESLGVTMTELAVRFALGIDGATCALTGVETVQQMVENAALFSKPAFEPTVNDAILNAFPALSDDVLIPSNWP